MKYTDKAFPSITQVDGNLKIKHPGMDIRTYAAIEAMKGLLANPVLGEREPENSIACLAISQAEALLDHLN
jgi:hypothetical protein